GRIELADAAPDLQISLLHHVGGQVVPSQDAQDDPINLGASGGIEAFEGRDIATGDRGEKPSDFNRRQHLVRYPPAVPWGFDYRRRTDRNAMNCTGRARAGDILCKTDPPQAGNGGRAAQRKAAHPLESTELKPA